MHENGFTSNGSSWIKWISEFIKSWTNWILYCCNRYNSSCVTLHIYATAQTVLDVLSLLLSLFQQDFLGLVQTKLQGVEFARVFLHCANVLPQLPAAFLPAQSGGWAWAGQVNRTIPAASFPVLWVAFWGSGMKDWLQCLQVLSERRRRKWDHNPSLLMYTIHWWCHDNNIQMAHTGR